MVKVVALAMDGIIFNHIVQDYAYLFVTALAFMSVVHVQVYMDHIDFIRCAIYNYHAMVVAILALLVFIIDG